MDSEKISRYNHYQELRHKLRKKVSAEGKGRVVNFGTRISKDSVYLVVGILPHDDWENTIKRLTPLFDGIEVKFEESYPYSPN